jgi:integrase/recombinase XerC
MRGLLGGCRRLRYNVYVKRCLVNIDPPPSRPVMTLPEPGAALPTPPDCTRLLDIFLARRSPRTLAAYQADLEDFRGYMRVATVVRAIERLIAYGYGFTSGFGFASFYARGYREQMIERGLPASTINRRLAMLRSLVKLAKTLGLVSWTLSVQSVENVPVQSSRDTQGLDRDGFRAMLAAAGAQPGPKGLRDVALLRLLHDLGLRRGEAVGLDVEDVELQRNWIFIPGETRSQRELVSLPEPTRAALAAWLEARGSEPGPLFINFDRAGKGHRLTGTAVYHIVGRLGAKAGLSVRPQGLRRLAITTALDRTNGDMRAVATFSRHKDLRNLSRYADNPHGIAGKVARLIAEE